MTKLRTDKQILSHYTQIYPPISWRRTWLLVSPSLHYKLNWRCQIVIVRRALVEIFITKIPRPKSRKVSWTYSISARRSFCFCLFEDDEYFRGDESDTATFQRKKDYPGYISTKKDLWCFVTSKLNRGMTTRLFILTKIVQSARRAENIHYWESSCWQCRGRSGIIYLFL